MIISGVLSLLVIKNDFRYPVPDRQASEFMRWVIDHTDKRSVFLERPDFYSPVALSGRFTYIGPDYYLTVMGYNTAKRRELMKIYYEATEPGMLDRVRSSNIAYVVIEKLRSENFPYLVDWGFWEKNTIKVFENNSIRVYKI